MNRFRFALPALALVLAIGIAPANSQEAEVSDVDFDSLPDSMEMQIAEMPEAATDTFALRMSHGRGGFGGGMSSMQGCPFLDGENALSDEQHEKFYQIKNRMKDDLGSKMLEMSKLRRQFGDELNSESIDVKAVSKLEDRMAALKGEISHVFTSSAVEMMNVLTPAQRKVLRQKMIRGSGMHGGMGRCEMGMGRGGGGAMMMRHHGMKGAPGLCPAGKD